MTKVQSWTLSMLAIIALAAGVLFASGAVSFAQEGTTTTTTPAATSGADDGEDGTTPSPSDDADNGTDDDTDSGTEKDGDGHNCPHGQQDPGTDDTSGADTSA